jgi:hypothetical protein
MALIRSHKAFETGEILAIAVLEPEPTNEFDPAAVTKMIKKSGKRVYEVPAHIGFDADSPAPLIGVKIVLTED